MFPKVGIFIKNNMILWYYQIRPKVVWKVHGAWIDCYDSQKKDKNITITKNKRLLFFLCSVSYSDKGVISSANGKNHVIHHHVIGALLDVIINILQR